MERKSSDEAKAMRYYNRLIFRIINLIIALFFLFVVLCGVIFFIPIVWNIAVSNF